MSSYSGFSNTSGGGVPLHGSGSYANKSGKQGSGNGFSGNGSSASKAVHSKKRTINNAGQRASDADEEKPTPGLNASLLERLQEAGHLLPDDDDASSYPSHNVSEDVKRIIAENSKALRARSHEREMKSVFTTSNDLYNSIPKRGNFENNGGNRATTSFVQLANTNDSSSKTSSAVGKSTNGLGNYYNPTFDPEEVEAEDALDDNLPPHPNDIFFDPDRFGDDDSALTDQSDSMALLSQCGRSTWDNTESKSADEPDVEKSSSPSEYRQPGSNGVSRRASGPCLTSRQEEHDTRKTFSSPTPPKSAAPGTSSTQGSSPKETPHSRKLPGRLDQPWRNRSGKTNSNGADGSNALTSAANSQPTTSTMTTMAERRTPARASGQNAQALYPTSACVFIGNLNHKASESDLYEEVTRAFRDFGVVFVKIRKDQHGAPNAFCQYTNVEDASKAILYGTGRIVCGRDVRVEKSKQNCTYYFYRLHGNSLTRREVREQLDDYVLEDLWVADKSIKALHNLPDGFFVRFGFYDSGREAFTIFNRDPTYKLANIKLEADTPKGGYQARGKFQRPTPFMQTVREDQHSIFVANLSPEATQGSIKDQFAKYGQIDDVKIITQQSKYQSQSPYRFGFVEFSNIAAVLEAIRGENGKFVDGLKLRVTQKDSQRSAPQTHPQGTPVQGRHHSRQYQRGGSNYATQPIIHHQPQQLLPMQAIQHQPQPVGPQPVYHHQPGFEPAPQRYHGQHPQYAPVYYVGQPQGYFQPAPAATAGPPQQQIHGGTFHAVPMMGASGVVNPFQVSNAQFHHNMGQLAPAYVQQQQQQPLQAAAQTQGRRGSGRASSAMGASSAGANDVNE